MADPWASPASDAPALVPAPTGTDASGEPSTDPVDVPRAVWADMSGNPAGYAAAGVAYLVFAMVAVVVILVLLFGSMAPGLFLGDDTLLALGGAVGFLMYILAILALALVIVPLQMASLVRVIDGAQRGEALLGVGSLFTHARENWLQVCLFYFVNQFLVTFGMLFLYVPGMVAAAVGSFAFPILVLEGTTVTEAYTRAWEHFKEHLGWHVGVWALALVAFVVLELTLVGLLVIMPVMCAWQVFAYRLAHGKVSSSG